LSYDRLKFPQLCVDLFRVGQIAGQKGTGFGCD
jgi:hypothetical protein